MDAAWKRIKTYMESSSACAEALKPLKAGVEIGLIFDGRAFALGMKDDKIFLEDRPAQKPDVVFTIKEEAVEPICRSPDDISEIGIAVLKQVKAKNIKIAMPGSFFSLLKNGYLEIIKTGGKTFWSYLSAHGLSNPTKILALIKKMKSG